MFSFIIQFLYSVQYLDLNVDVVCDLANAVNSIVF